MDKEESNVRGINVSRRRFSKRYAEFLKERIRLSKLQIEVDTAHLDKLEKSMKVVSE